MHGAVRQLQVQHRSFSNSLARHWLDRNGMHGLLAWPDAGTLRSAPRRAQR
jgi:hypothetical protein